jgi:hypothetical protein
MANRTLTNIRRDVRRYLKESDADTSFWTDAFLNQLINAAYRRRCAQLMMAHEGWFVTVATRDLTEDQDRYAFPDNLQQLTKIELVRTDGHTIPLRRFERHEEINASEGGLSDSYFPTYRPMGNGFILEPKPKETVTGGLRIEYTGLPAELSADGDSFHNSFPEIFEELVLLDVVVSAFDAEGQQEQGLVRSILRLRSEWEWDWERFVDSRTISRQQVTPFTPHYIDS